MSPIRFVRLIRASMRSVLTGAALMLTGVAPAALADYPDHVIKAVVPFAALMLLNRPKEGVRPIAESAFAGLLVVAALFTGFKPLGRPGLPALSDASRAALATPSRYLPIDRAIYGRDAFELYLSQDFG